MRTLFIVVAVLTAWTGVTFAQTEAETKTTVPELAAFHEVIYPLWHNAYPNKDTALMRQLWPEVQKHVTAVEKAELPGILRDKKAAWQEGIEKLKAVEKAYGDALAKGTLEAKLKAAEDLHSVYEGLVRTLRPVLPELAKFHESLYKIYHYYLPNKDRKQLQESLPLLTSRMDTLNSAKLPKRLEKSQAEFEKARAILSAKVKEVAQAVPKGDWKKNEKAIEEMHTAYQAVERIFD